MTQATTARKTGQSFQPKRNNYFTNDSHKVEFNGKRYETAAQLMTAIGYGDSNNLAVRSLDYCVKCEDFKDLKSCLKIIGSYNDFDAERIIKSAVWPLNLQHYLNEGNQNNGKQLFEFHIAREYSPAFYVKYNGKYNCWVITDREPAEATETQPAGEILYFEEYTEADFTERMSRLSKEIGADEFSIKTEYTYSSGENCLIARFWWD